MHRGRPPQLQPDRDAAALSGPVVSVSVERTDRSVRPAKAGTYGGQKQMLQQVVLDSRLRRE
jgi:hypothetical protein